MGNRSCLQFQRQFQFVSVNLLLVIQRRPKTRQRRRRRLKTGISENEPGEDGSLAVPIKPRVVGLVAQNHVVIDGIANRSEQPEYILVGKIVRLLERGGAGGLDENGIAHRQPCVRRDFAALKIGIETKRGPVGNIPEHGRVQSGQFLIDAAAVRIGFEIKPVQPQGGSVLFAIGARIDARFICFVTSSTKPKIGKVLRHR